MPIQDLPPKHCFDLREADPSLVHLDVRTPEEFARGHPEGALNVPFLLQGPQGRAENPEFLGVAQRVCADPERRVILSCASGRRSRWAGEALAEAGYANLVNMRGGYDGSRGPGGELSEQGWAGLGLPTSQDAGQRSWDALRGEG